MKIFDVADRLSGSGEYILGSKELGSHACYLIHGVLGPGEQGRVLKPGAGHEEIVLALTGDLALTGAFNGTLKQGQAVHLVGEETCTAGNPSDREVRYVVAGGHGGHGHH